MKSWGLYKDKKDGPFVIRRGKKRLPISRYRNIRNDEALLKSLVIRLNEPIRALEVVQFKHALINDARLEEYKAWLLLQVENQHNARNEFNVMKRHLLDYFIGKLNLMKPEEWLRAHKTKWAAYLLSTDKDEGGDFVVPQSPKAKRAIIQAANRFLTWMNEHYPEFMPPMKFTPFSKSKNKNLNANWEQNPDKLKRLYINPGHWTIINKALDNMPNLAPLVRLGYHYGLRRREAQGVRAGDVMNDYLRIKRQLVRITPTPTYAATKGREARDIPHWFAKNAEAYAWVLGAEKLARSQTPTDFSRAWMDFIQTLVTNHSLPHYHLHDLRHTFITRAMRKKKPVDVMRAAGHKNIETTMAYLHDDRNLGDEEFKPAS